MTEDEIINAANEWKRSDERIQIERIRLQHRRRVWAWWVLCAIAVVLGVTVGSVHGCGVYRARRQAEDAERRERSKAQEEAWRDCMHYLGPERCNAIEARLAERCLDSGAHTSSCLRWEVQ